VGRSIRLATWGENLRGLVCSYHSAKPFYCPPPPDWQPKAAQCGIRISMEPLTWAVTALLSLLLAFTRAFSSSTLVAGKALVLPSDLDSEESAQGVNRLMRTGFQSAVTPPWSTKLALLVYFSISVSEVSAWFLLGWRTGLLSMGILIVSSVILKRLFDRFTQRFFFSSMFKSMLRRSERWALAGHQSRAEAMNNLLDRIEQMMYKDSAPADYVN